MPYSAENVVDQREVMRLVLERLDGIATDHEQVAVLRPTDEDPEVVEGGPSVFIRLVSIDHAPSISNDATDELTINVQATCTEAQLVADPGTLAWAASRIRAQLDNARGMEAETSPTHRVMPRWGRSRIFPLRIDETRFIHAAEVVFTGSAVRTAGDTLGDPFAA